MKITTIAIFGFFVIRDTAEKLKASKVKLDKK